MSERSPVVLVVEDEKQIRRFVRASLEEEGCRVFEAGTLDQWSAAFARDRSAGQ